MLTVICNLLSLIKGEMQQVRNDNEEMKRKIRAMTQLQKLVALFLIRCTMNKLARKVN